MNTSEDWKPFPDFPAYAVSNLGRVKRVMADAYGRMNGRIISQKMTRGGYLQCSLTRERERLTVLVSRAVCEAFHGFPPSPVHQAAHKDGVCRNNKAENLRWATRSENENDKVAHGTARIGAKHHATMKPECVARGSRVGTSKLTEDAVARIRADTRTRSEIATAHNITKSHVSDIRSRKVWRHVP